MATSPNLVHMLVEEKKYADFFVTEYTADELQELGDYIKPNETISSTMKALNY